MVDLAYRLGAQENFTEVAKAVRAATNEIGKSVKSADQLTEHFSKSMANAGQVSEETSERVRRASKSFQQIVNSNDLGTKAAAKFAKEQANLRRELEEINREYKNGLVAIDEYNKAIADANAASAVRVAKIERQIAIEKRNRDTISDTTEATTAQARALQGLRSQYDSVYAAQQRLGTSMRDIEKLERSGFVNAQQARTLREQETRAYAERHRELTGVAQAEREAAQAAKERAAEQRRAAEEQAAQARSLEALRGQYDPLYAAAQKYGQARRDITTLEQEGLVTAARAAEIREREATAYEQRIRDLSGVTAAERQAAQAANEHAAELRRAAEEQAAQVRSLEALRGQYDPLYAAGQKYGQVLRDITTLEQEGAVTAARAVEIREREAVAYEKTRRELTGVAAAERAATAAAEEHAAELQRLQGRLTGYVHAMDPVAASLATVERAERDLLEARRLGLAVSSDQVAAVIRQRERHEELAASSRQMGGAIRLQAHEWTNLSAQIQDLVVQIGSGQGFLLPLLQQAPQATGAVGGTGRAMALLRQELTPTRLAMLGVTAAVVAMAVAVHTQESALSSLRSGLRGVTTDYAAAAIEMEASAKRIAAAGLGIDRQQARDGLLSLRQAAPRGASIDYQAAGRDAADLAAVLRTEVAAGFELMARMGKDAGAVVEELREKGIRGMTRELQGQAEALQANGQRWEAQTLVMGRLRPVIQGAAQDVPPLTAAVRELRSAWDGFLDSVGGGLAASAATLLRDMTAAAQAIVAAVERVWALARQVPVLGRFVGAMDDIDAAGPQGAANAAARSLGVGSPGATDRALGQMGRAFGPATPTAVTAQSISVPWSVPADLRPAFASAAATTGVDVELLARVFAREGVRNRDGSWRESRVGAIGPMQVMPGTFSDMAQRYGIAGTARDDAANVMASARYLAELIKRSPDDLPRALAGYNAGPDRDGLGLPALGGTYARRVLDGYTGSGLIIRAQQTEISGTSANPLVLPEVRVEASADIRLDRALAISRGELKPEPHSSRETQSAWYRQAMGEIETARGLTEDPRSLDILRNGYREVTKALEAARGPQEQWREGVDRAYASARILDPAQRALTEAVQAYEERVKAVGDIPTDAGRNEARAAKLRELGVAYAAAGYETGQALQQQDRLAAAWGQGREAVERLTAEEKAREVVRAAGIQGEAAQEAAVRELADAYQLLTTRQADNAQRAANDNARDNLAVLEEERRLIGAAADERERELAGYRAVQQARRGGVRDEGVLAETRQLARSTVDVTRANTQLRNSWNELSRVGEQAFDRIGGAITEAFANGSLRAVDFKNIAKAALSEVGQAAMRMALVNPVLNYMDGGTRGTLGGVLQVAGVMGGGGAAANDNRSGNGGGGMLGYAKQGMQAYSAYNKLSGINPTNFINGTRAISTGWGGLDAALNTTAVSWGGNAAATAQLGQFADTGMTLGNTVSAPASGASTLSYGGAALGTLGVAAGAYGVYSGLKRGGVGGYTSAAGSGLSAGLSVAAMAGMSVPVAGWIAAAALMVAGALLPGQKPSDKTGTAIFNTLDPTNPEIGGLNGARYSAENREQARGIGTQLSAIAKTVGDAAGLSRAVAARYEVAFGSRDGVKIGVNGQTLQGAANQEGITALTKAFASQMISLAREQTTDSNVRNVIDRSGNADPEATLGNLEWYRTTYKGLSDTIDPIKTSSFARAMEEVQTKFDAIREKATSLALSLDPVTKAFEKERDALHKARVTAFDKSISEMMDQAGLLRGGDVLPLQLAAFDRQRTAEWEAMQAGIWDQGFDQNQVNDAWKAFIPLKELQRQALIDQNEGVRTASNNSMYDRLRTSNGTSRETTLDEALWDYNRKALVEYQAATKDGITDLTLLTKVQAEERLAIERQYADRAAAIRQSYEDRIWAATADTSTMAGALADFDRTAMRERLEAAKQAGADLVLLEQAQGAERSKLIRQFAEQEREALRSLGGGIRAYVDGLRVTPNGGLSPAEQLRSAQEIFGRDLTLARGGDQDALGRITGTADTLLSAGRQMYASGQEFQQLRDWITSSLEALPATRSYDSLILEELRKLGGGIDVSVELTTVRIITEQLNALPATERDRLIQAGVVLRSVEDRLSRPLTAVERGLLIDSAVVLRDVEQGLGRDLTAAERGLLLDSAEIRRTVQQALERDLTAAERDGLVQAATVQRLVEQQLGRQLTAAERATLLDTVTATRTVEERLGRQLTAAEQAALIQGGQVLRTVSQTVETTETVQISRSIDDKLSGLLEKLIGISSDVKGSLARMAGADDGVTIRLGADANTLFQDMRGYAKGTYDRQTGEHGGIVVKPSAPFEVYARDKDGVLVQTSQKYNEAWSPVRFAKGGVLGAGRGEILTGPTDMLLGDGTAIQAGEAGAEGILPLGRDRQGRMGVHALVTLEEPMAPLMPEVPMPALPPMPLLGGGDAETQAELQALRKQLADLHRLLAAAEHRKARAEGKAQQTAEQTAEGVEDMAQSNRRLAAHAGGSVGKRAEAR